MTEDRPSEEIAGLPEALSELPWSADFVMQAIEILPVCAAGSGVEQWQPAHADSFIVGWPAGERPEVVARVALEQLGFRPVILHSTSWRHQGAEVVLTYLAVVTVETPPADWSAVRIARARLARGDATAPPSAIGVAQVLEHALRHLAWLMREDPAIQETIPEWRTRLAGYEPEPFRAFGPPA